MHRKKWKLKHDNPKLWDSVKAMLWVRFIANHAYLKKQEKNQINNPTLHLTQLEKEGGKKKKHSIREEIRTEITEKETKETVAKIS